MAAASRRIGAKPRLLDVGRKPPPVVIDHFGVAQVDRQGCALIVSSQWPSKVGMGLMFISLDVDVLRALRQELEGRGVGVKDGFWGYPLMIVHDLDGNELYFNYPNEGDVKTAADPAAR